MNDWGSDGWAVHPGRGQRVDTGPHWLEVLVRGADVDGAMGVFVFTHDRILENPPHAHLNFMKVLYVLEGEYEFRVGEATFSGSPGTVVVIPRASQHAFTTATGGRILFVCCPAGNEEMFLEMGRLGPHATDEQLAEVARRFAMVPLAGDAYAWRPPASAE
ncbi:MAG: cupin domain-containing protein [Chloroflexi bacterium]|nr:cupin domain-containing protein [Chloroflexota bacterium]